MRGFFITGTDTGVGKTVLTATLLTGLRRRGIDAWPMKAVQTGGDPAAGIEGAPDLHACLRAAGLEATDAVRPHLNPYCFIPPCSPHLAAREAGVPIELEAIARHAEALDAAGGGILVEGAGGILVPLGPAVTMRDLALRLGLPAVIAARPGLGTLNHTLLSLESLARSAAPVVAVVIIESEPSERGPVERDNLATLRRACGVPIFGPLPFVPGYQPGAPLPHELADAAGEILDFLVPRLDSPGPAHDTAPGDCPC